MSGPCTLLELHVDGDCEVCKGRGVVITDMVDNDGAKWTLQHLCDCVHGAYPDTTDAGTERPRPTLDS